MKAAVLIKRAARSIASAVGRIKVDQCPLSVSLEVSPGIDSQTDANGDLIVKAPLVVGIDTARLIASAFRGGNNV